MAKKYTQSAFDFGFEPLSDSSIEGVEESVLSNEREEPKIQNSEASTPTIADAPVESPKVKQRKVFLKPPTQIYREEPPIETTPAAEIIPVEPIAITAEITETKEENAEAAATSVDEIVEVDMAVPQDHFEWEMDLNHLSVEASVREEEEDGSVTISIKTRSNRGRKSTKAMDAEVEKVNIPNDEILFSRQYYPIGEVANMFGVNVSMIRYWEKEFTVLQPKKNKKGDRLFRPQDIKNLQLIHYLIRQRKFTLSGAKDFLKKHKGNANLRFEVVQSLQQLKSFLLELKTNL